MCIYNIKILYIYIVPFPLYFSRICHAPAFHVFRTLFPYVRLCLTLFNYSFAIIWVILCSMVLLTFICCSCSLSVYICWHLPLGPLQVGPQFCRKNGVTNDRILTSNTSLSLSLSPSLQSIAILNLVFVISICFYLFHSVSNIS